MRKLFKKYFIPHPGNDHKPHILRLEASLVILSAVLILETLFLLNSFLIYDRTDFFAAILPDVLVDETNINRETANINLLNANPLLQEAARLKAENMAANGYFAHTSPDGKNPWYWLEEVGYSFALAGENLAVNFINSNDVTEAWMDSPGHRENILNGDFTEIGIAAAKGKYKGNETTFVVQFFGRPASGIARAQVQPELTGEAGEKGAVTALSDEMFIEVEGVAVEGILTDVQEVDFVPQSSFTERFAAKPGTAANYLLLTLATIVSLALVLKIFIATNIQHPPLIVNGTLLLIIISSAILLNQYLSVIGVQIV